MNSEHMVAGLGENKRQDFTINNIQGQELITTKFKHGTWFLRILEVVKVAGNDYGNLEQARNFQ